MRKKAQKKTWEEDRDMKKIWAALPALALVLVLWVSPAALALDAAELVPVGDTVGIEIKMDGVLVVETGEVETADGKLSPARSAGIRPGDVIVSVNGRAVKTAAEFLSAAENLDGNPVEILAKREAKEIKFSVSPAPASRGGWQLGLWLRDGASGIGTVSFYDPKSGIYGALGHGINDLKSGELMPIDAGSILNAQVTEVVPGREGSPGELRGSIDKTDLLGSIAQNSICGIFGKANPGCFEGSPLPVASPGEVLLGEASILSNVVGDETREYSVEICRIYRGSDDVRNLMICVTDPELLSITGGIVQGMSGSPIIQNGKLVGAVTHVLVNDPTRGYGIFIENMLDAAS